MDRGHTSGVKWFPRRHFRFRMGRNGSPEREAVTKTLRLKILVGKKLSCYVEFETFLSIKWGESVFCSVSTLDPGWGSTVKETSLLA